VNLKIAGDLAGAIAAHEAAIAREPSYAQAHVNLISLFAEARDWAKVEAHYRAAVALGFGLAGANLDYGMAQERQSHWDLAEAAYRRAVAVNPEHAGARVSLGRMLERRKDFEAAAAEYRLALASQPTHRVARYDLARMLTALGRPLEAITEFERVIEPRDESTPAVLLGLAAALARVGRHTEAAGRLAEARALAVDYQRQDLIDLIDRVTPALTTPKAER
jgi:tetratricopeptide (TPR) repeat protein